MKQLRTISKTSGAYLLILGVIHSVKADNITSPTGANVRQNSLFSGAYSVNSLHASDAEVSHQSSIEATLRGEKLLNEGKTDLAIAALEQAVSFVPCCHYAYRSLAVAYTKVGRVTDAVAAYKSLLNPDPEWSENNLQQGVPSDWMHYALLLLQTGQKDKALLAYQAGYRNLKADRGPIPLPLTDSSITNEQLQALAYAGIGIWEHNWGDDDANFERAINLDPHLAAAYFYHGLYLKWKPGHEAEAITSFRTALQLDNSPVTASFVDKELQNGTRAFRDAVKVPQP